MALKKYYGQTRLLRDAQASGLVVLNEDGKRTVIDSGNYSVTMSADGIRGSDGRELTAEAAKEALGL